MKPDSTVKTIWGTTCVQIFTSWKFPVDINMIKALRSPTVKNIPYCLWHSISQTCLIRVLLSEHLLRWNLFGKCTSRCEVDVQIFHLKCFEDNEFHKINSCSLALLPICYGFNVCVSLKIHELKS